MSFLKTFIHNSRGSNSLKEAQKARNKSAMGKKWFSVFAILIMSVASISFTASAKSDFVVVIDPGHGGKDHGAIDNDAREKDINLAVAKRLGELIEKKLDDTKVVYTRNTDTFISLQDRAAIANKAKGDLFISIHTNSVDANNKNRASVAGASVYTLGNHKDDANMGVARRENSVIELENGYKQKYSGFDPNKDESYIIFEMAQKNDITRSNRFAKNVQDNLVKIAGRKDRGVHQAGFWVLWSTSMPSVLVELDFICNPESAKYMTSKDGVNEMADAIFRAVKTYEQNVRQSERMAQNQKNNSKSAKNLTASANDNGKQNASKGSNKKSIKQNTSKGANNNTAVASAPAKAELSTSETVAVAYVPEEEERDLSHNNLKATSSQKKPRSKADGRRRRSLAARNTSSSRDVEGTIRMYTEFTGETTKVQPEPLVASAADKSNAATTKSTKDNKNSKKTKNSKDSKNKKVQVAKKDNNKETTTTAIVRGQKVQVRHIDESNHKTSGQRKSLKSNNSSNKDVAEKTTKTDSKKKEDAGKKVVAKNDNSKKDSQKKEGTDKKVVAKNDNKKDSQKKEGTDKKVVVKNDNNKKDSQMKEVAKANSDNNNKKKVGNSSAQKSDVAKTAVQSTYVDRTTSASSAQMRHAGKRKSLKSHDDD